MTETDIQWTLSVMTALMLFLHGLAAFSDEVTRLGGEKLKALLGWLTRSDAMAALAGAIGTAVVQSSSAVTSMAVGLAHKRALSPRGVMGILIGANVGTTLTAWMVARSSRFAFLGTPRGRHNRGLLRRLQLNCQWQPVPVRDDHHFGAVAFFRFADFWPPFLAAARVPSMMHSSHFSLPAASRIPRKACYMRLQAPASSHS